MGMSCLPSILPQNLFSFLFVLESLHQIFDFPSKSSDILVMLKLPRAARLGSPDVLLNNLQGFFRDGSLLIIEPLDQ